MRYLLSPSSRALIAQLAQERTLCAFDFDGTLSPIVEDPARTAMRAGTRKLLDRVAELYPCIVISGRARADLLVKLDGVNVARAIGNHGAETESNSQLPRRQIERWKAVLTMELGAMEGVWVENKGYSLAVHYRQSEHKTEARRRILAATGRLKHVRVLGGKQVLNLMLDSAPDKGKALAAERDRLRCNWVLYVGDDANDEDAFALGGNIVPVRIGRKRQSQARYYLRRQTEIDKLLKLLVQRRSGSRGTPIYSRNSFAKWLPESEAEKAAG